MLNGIKSKYIIFQIFNILEEKRILQLIRHNKYLQNLTGTSIDNYKTFLNIEIELIPKEKVLEGDIFINYIDKPSYFHIFFNDNEKEEKINYITKKQKIERIRIILDNKIKLLRGLFKECKCLKEIYFTKFNRKDINDFGELFEDCSSLIKLDISKLRTDNAKKMDWMFYKCINLKELNIENLKTDNVIDMTAMFKHCELIKELNLSNFNTSNVVDMKGMFFKCLSLETLDLNHFNTTNVTDMRWMFDGCSSLRNLYINNFDTTKVIDMRWMFEGCSSLNNLDTTSNIFNGDIDMESFPIYYPQEIKIKQ